MAKNWKLMKRISKKKRIGTVYLVEDGKRIGFFKHSTSTSEKASGPLAANEYLAYLLGKELGLPIAPIELVEMNGQSGIVSIKMTNKEKVYNWIKLRKMEFPTDYIRCPERLISMFIFDVWIINIDRNNRNIILYKSDDSKEKFDFYLIDHGLSLLGAVKWKNVPLDNDTYWKNVEKYNNRYLKGLPEYLMAHAEAVKTNVREIQSISDKRVKKIVNKVPSSIINEAGKKELTRFLCQRKKLLHEIIDKWLNDYKKN